jgi:hypothetical protein
MEKQEKIKMEVLKLKHILALIIKFVLVAIVVFSIFSSFENVTLANGIFVSILITGIAYVIGDLMILRRFGNLTATLADFALAFLALFLYGVFLDLPIGHAGNAAGFSALFIAFGEAFIHYYLINRIFGEPEYTDEDGPHVREVLTKKLRTETADEVFPYDVKQKNDNKNKNND